MCCLYVGHSYSHSTHHILGTETPRFPVFFYIIGVGGMAAAYSITPSTALDHPSEKVRITIKGWRATGTLFRLISLILEAGKCQMARDTIWYRCQPGRQPASQQPSCLDRSRPRQKVRFAIENPGTRKWYGKYIRQIYGKCTGNIQGDIGGDRGLKMPGLSEALGMLVLVTF